MRRCSFVLIVAAAGALAAAPAFAGTVVTGLQDTLVAQPFHYIGHCPGRIVFTGTIDVRGDFQNSQKAEIGYRFTRSDGAVSPNRYIEVTGPGVYHVSETWTLGGADLPEFSGWEKFKAWPTDSAQNRTGDTWSNQGHFNLTCRGR